MRALFLLVVVVGLTIFALQNVEPALSLVFLGIRSPQAPLSIWILLSMGAGVVTSLLISGLLAFSNYLSGASNRTGRESPRPDTFGGDRRTAYTPPPPPRKPEIDPLNLGNTEIGSASYRTEYGTPTGYNSRTVLQETAVPNPPKAKDYTQPTKDVAADDEDDWVSDNSKIGSVSSEDDWGDENRENVGRPTVNDATEPNPRNYEAPQKPKSQSWAGSVYSYGYRDPSQSGVGQTESVYDAEYRVLVPPDGAIPAPADKKIPKSNSAEEDDWGLDEDDEFDDDRPNDKQRPDRS